MRGANVVDDSPILIAARFFVDTVTVVSKRRIYSNPEAYRRTRARCAKKES